ncbi:penicillin-binding protein activator, partial [Lysobacter zhanggongensis]
ALLRRGLPLPRPFDRVAWQFDASARPPAEADGYRPPVRLAVLLPLSGDLSAAAAPVRDGLLAGYYGESRRRPEVRFYDTHGTAGGALAAYDRAAGEGNDFMVGPLGRDEVGALFNRGALAVPVLALNRAGDVPPAGNASFSLSPEDEGIAAAGLLLERGARRVLVIAGSDDSQRRAVDALRNHLAEHGATVTGIASAGIADYSPYAQAEGGVDAVFLAVRGNVAREAMPRLALAGLAG